MSTKAKNTLFDIHRVLHNLVAYLDKKIGFRKDVKNFSGYPAMQIMEKYIKRSPTIKEIRVDDSYNASSSLYLIPHESENEYWGTTVMFLPQCTKNQSEFFLYPRALNDLIKQLQAIQKRQRRLEKK